MRRERILRIFVGSPEEVERRANDLLAERAVILTDRVYVRHWGTDPVSLVIFVERNPDDPEVKELDREQYREVTDGKAVE